MLRFTEVNKRFQLLLQVLLYSSHMSSAHTSPLKVTLKGNFLWQNTFIEWIKHLNSNPDAAYQLKGFFTGIALACVLMHGNDVHLRACILHMWACTFMFICFSSAFPHLLSSLRHTVTEPVNRYWYGDHMGPNTDFWYHFSVSQSVASKRPHSHTPTLPTRCTTLFHWRLATAFFPA